MEHEVVENMSVASDNLALMLVSATPPLLALGFLTTIKGSLPPRAKACSSSLARVCKRSLSSCTSLKTSKRSLVQNENFGNDFLLYASKR